MSLESDAVRFLLDRAGVPQDGVLVIHCGFRGLSRAGCRAEVFIAALLDQMRGGTLAMPAMSWRSVTPQAPDWDERTTPSHVGVLAETFRTRFAECRSIHPTHSVAASGPAARALVADHELGDTPCPAASPWGRLAAAGAHILLLGTGFETCTALHHPEEVVAPDRYLRPRAEAQLYRCAARDGTVFAVRVRPHLRLNRIFGQYESRLAGRGRLAAGTLMGTPWFAVAAQDLMAEAFANLMADCDAHIARDFPLRAERRIG